MNVSSDISPPRFSAKMSYCLPHGGQQIWGKHFCLLFLKPWLKILGNTCFYDLQPQLHSPLKIETLLCILLPVLMHVFRQRHRFQNLFWILPFPIMQKLGSFYWPFPAWLKSTSFKVCAPVCNQGSLILFSCFFYLYCTRNIFIEMLNLFNNNFLHKWNKQLT